MQNTRLNTLVSTIGQQIRQELRNPWRRIAVLVIALLFGIYVGISFAAIAGQLAYIDIIGAGLVLLSTELVSWIFYRNWGNAHKALWGEALNAFKLGLIYGLFLIAFMLGS
jgi:hypothetical protein